MVTWLVVVGCIGSFYWLYLVDWFVNWLYGLLVSVVEKTQTAEIQNPNQFYQAQSIRLKHFKLHKLWAKLGKIEENWAKLGKTGRNSVKLEEKLSKTDENWIKLGKTGQNWAELGKIWRKLNFGEMDDIFFMRFFLSIRWPIILSARA